MPLNLSVLLMTSPGREAYLERCLQRLDAQTDRAFEVVVVDDGSSGSDEILARYENRFDELVYLWRENDRHVSVSRNLGMTYAQGDWCICLDSDLLLNEFAVASYRKYAAELRHHQVLYGAYGHTMRTTSHWYPEVDVAVIDPRFLTAGTVANARFLGQAELPAHYLLQDGLWYPRNLLAEPELNAAGGNFMMHRETFQSTGGFNEELSRWEDLYFGMTLSRKGCEIHFTADTWAEHQCHPGSFSSEVQQQSQARFFQEYMQLQDISYQVQVFTAAEPLAYLERVYAQALQAVDGFGISHNVASSANQRFTMDFGQSP